MEHRGWSPFGKRPREIPKGTDGHFKILGMKRNQTGQVSRPVNPKENKP